MTETAFNALPTGHAQSTISSTVVELASLIPSTTVDNITVKRTPHHCLIYVGGDAIRYSTDGVDPTNSSGILVAAGSYINWSDPQGNYLGLIQKCKMIRVTSDAVIDVEFYN